MTYTATISGSNWSRGPVAQFASIDECRDWAEEYGTTADRCTVTDDDGDIVALFARNPNGNGTEWFEADPGA